MLTNANPADETSMQRPGLWNDLLPRYYEENSIMQSFRKNFKMQPKTLGFTSSYFPFLTDLFEKAYIKAFTAVEKNIS